MRKLVIQFEFNLLHVHTLGITNSIAVIWAQRKGCVLGRKKMKHPVNNSPLAFHTSHSASLSSMGAWHTNTPGHLRWKAKSHCHCYHISQLQEALPWHTGEYGLILIPAYVWVCFHQRGQSGLMEFSDTGYKGYKRCLWRKTMPKNQDTLSQQRQHCIFGYLKLKVASYQPGLWSTW